MVHKINKNGRLTIFIWTKIKMILVLVRYTFETYICYINQQPMKTWEAKLLKHKGEDRIAVYFKKDKDLIDRIKKLEGVRFSWSLCVWHLPDTDEYRERFGIEPRFVLNPEHAEKIEEFKQWLQSKRYSENTVIAYCDALKVFLTFFNTKPAGEITDNDIITFNNDFILKNGLSSSYQNQIVNAIKKFFGIVESRQVNIELIHRPRREKKLPNVLSKEDITLILNAHCNLKHRVMLYQSNSNFSENEYGIMPLQ